MSGPLSGVRIIEMGGIGPAPFAAMLLVDHGAEVIRIDRPNTTFGILDAMLRSRKLVELDLKLADDISTARELIGSADILIESFRPGTMERLGLGPDVLMADNPKLIYCRMTGWGQSRALRPLRRSRYQLYFPFWRAACGRYGRKADTSAYTRRRPWRRRDAFLLFRR